MTRQKIMQRVAGLLVLTGQLEQRLAQARRQVAALLPAILGRAFKRKL